MYILNEMKNNTPFIKIIKYNYGLGINIYLLWCNGPFGINIKYKWNKKFTLILNLKYKFINELFILLKEICIHL